MENKKQYCGNLYQEYKKLLPKSKMDAYDLSPSGKINHPIPFIKSEDMVRIKKVKKELVGKCKSFLNLKPYEWFEIDRENFLKNPNSD